jgi:Lipid A 3-O-deacylase (PagL)
LAGTDAVCRGLQAFQAAINRYELTRQVRQRSMKLGPLRPKLRDFVVSKPGKLLQPHQPTQGVVEGLWIVAHCFIGHDAPPPRRYPLDMQHGRGTIEQHTPHTVLHRRAVVGLASLALAASPSLSAEAGEGDGAHRGDRLVSSAERHLDAVRLRLAAVYPELPVVPEIADAAEQGSAGSVALDEDLVPRASASLAVLATNDEPSHEPADTAATPRAAAGGLFGPSGKRYLDAGSKSWTIGGLYASNFDQSHDANLHIAFSTFLADRFEFVVELGGWYFDQPGRDASGNRSGRETVGGLSGSMVFRWHFYATDDREWSVFADAGIGLLAAFDQVPSGGTEFNFLPRIGLGLTKALGDNTSGQAPRLMLGARWHHISNARIKGDDRNPARDSLAGYVAIVFPF